MRMRNLYRTMKMAILQGQITVSDLTPENISDLRNACGFHGISEFSFRGETRQIFLCEVPFEVKGIRISEDDLVLIVAGAKSDRIKNKWTNKAKQILKQRVNLEWL